jgi:hypothetical protein
MYSLGNNLINFMVAWVVFGLCMATDIMAAAPESQTLMTARASPQLYMPRRGELTRSAADFRNVAPLDLRAPVDVSAPSGATSPTAAFPSARRTPISANYEEQLPALGAADKPALGVADKPALGAADKSVPRIAGRAEVIAHRVLHEGIPIVRLWEGHTALVSLGLNPSRKLGLWLIQKVK